MASLKQNHVFRNIILVLLPIVTAIVCMGIGRMSMSPGEIVTNLFEIAVHGPESVDPQIYSVLISVRLPRIILAVLCGAGLAVSGAAFQSIFSNALATPDTLGVAAGSSFGAALALLLGMGLITVQVSALAVGFVAVLMTYIISRQKSGASTVMVILSGMVIASLFEAGISIIKFIADTESQLPAITYWLMGSLANTSFSSLALGAPFIIAGIAVIFALRWKLNVLMLSEDEAKTMGGACGNNDHGVLRVYVRAGRLGRAFDPPYLPDALWQQQPEYRSGKHQPRRGIFADYGYGGAQRDCRGDTDLYFDVGDRRAVLYYPAQKDGRV